MEAPITPICKRLFFIAAINCAVPALADAGNLSAYLQARAAEGDHRVELAAASYARALAQTHDNPVVAIHAYREALTAGDLALAAKAGTVLSKAGVAPADVPLLALAEAARGNDAAAADAAITKLAAGRLAILVPALRGWTALVRGADPLPALDAARADPIASRLAAENRALLLIATHRTAEGLAAIEALKAGGAAVELRIAASELLIGAGQRDEATALLTGDDPLLVAARGGQGARPTLGFGVSRLLSRVAADLQEGEPALPIALTRAALAADPSDDRARLLLAGALARGGAVDAALAALSEMPAASTFAELAMATRIGILAASGRTAEALAAGRAAAERPGSNAADWQRYADLLVGSGRFADAASLYRRVLDAAPNAGWVAWLQYGGALDQAGRWPEARAALARAVALGPNEPLALNYLGYARLQHGEDIAGSLRLLQRASMLAPTDPSIADSLGWAYHRAGDTARALPLLERAAAAEPGNAEIGEHLGDAYWSLGRRYEARYAWRAAELGADAEGDARLAGKIASGLSPRR